MDAQQDLSSGSTPGPIWWSLAAGFLAWGLDLGFGYVLVRHACSAGRNTALAAATCICLLIALSGLIPGVIAYRRLPHDTSEEGGRPHDRAHFQALLGIAFSISFALIILAASVPQWILRPCS
jgi:hypothetical protein